MDGTGHSSGAVQMAAMAAACCGVAERAPLCMSLMEYVGPTFGARCNGVDGVVGTAGRELGDDFFW